MRTLLLSGIFSALLWPNSGVAQPSPVSADIAILANACATCHGVSYRGGHGIPGLRGNNAQAVGVMLRAFKADERPATIMNRLAKGYSEAEIDALAFYFGSMK